MRPNNIFCLALATSLYALTPNAALSSDDVFPQYSNSPMQKRSHSSSLNPIPERKALNSFVSTPTAEDPHEEASEPVNENEKWEEMQQLIEGMRRRPLIPYELTQEGAAEEAEIFRLQTRLNTLHDDFNAGLAKVNNLMQDGEAEVLAMLSQQPVPFPARAHQRLQDWLADQIKD